MTRAFGGLRLREFGPSFSISARRSAICALVALDVRAQLGERGARLRELVALLFAHLARVRDGLFGAADLRADLVVARLHGAHALGLLVLVDALRLDGRFRGALVGERLLHRELAFAHRAVLHLGAGIDLAQPQCQQLRGQAPLGFLERLVAARGRRLALQVTDLLVDFVAHVLQALEVLARVGDTRLGLLAALLVTRDAGGLLDEGAHVIGAWPR